MSREVVIRENYIKPSVPSHVSTTLIQFLFLLICLPFLDSNQRETRYCHMADFVTCFLITGEGGSRLVHYPSVKLGNPVAMNFYALLPSRKHLTDVNIGPVSKWHQHMQRECVCLLSRIRSSHVSVSDNHMLSLS